MADPVAPVVPPVVEPAPVVPPVTPPAPPALPAKEPDPVPYGRFKDVNDELQTLKTAEAKRLEQEALDKGEHQKIIDGLKPKAERAEKLEATINDVITAEMKGIPAERHSLVPASLPAEEKLAWITANRAFLTGKAGSVNHPVNPADGAAPEADKTTFTKAQINDPDFYEKNKEAIKKAVQAGRITD